ncbi:nicotinate phosphoribosyltransferase [Inquilinus sp. OTU3971]|uniref:nicotinate phosphoribosyltransferase n=1 Tax=Inquilinus sp. OTU3971 TaxID=3043855 RepID=UPI00313E0F4F
MVASESPLLLDLYQFTMMSAYFEHGMTAPAVFEFFVRELPARRGFLMAAGLEQVLDYLEGLRFGEDDLRYLAQIDRFSAGFLDYLAGFRFSGDVDAMPEGTVFFPDEPVIRVTAPLPEAQMVETRLVNLLQFQTIVASKAARMVLAAPGKRLVDFGLRRAHGAEAGLLAARAAYLAGFTGTATLLAEQRFGIPAFGTMAHSFIQAHDDETLAFERFARARPRDLVLLIDTYDTERGVQRVVELAPRLAGNGVIVRGVRIDSGDLAEHARRVRAILDAGGLGKVQVFASGGLDEDDLLAFTARAVPIDAYGIGTSLTTSSDAPALDCAYKLQEYDGTPRRKRSEGKATWLGRKQVWRRYDAGGTIAGDVVALEAEQEAGRPLLQPVMRGGRRLPHLPTPAEARQRAAGALASLPASLRGLGVAAPPVRISDGLQRLAEACDRRDPPLPR